MVMNQMPIIFIKRPIFDQMCIIVHDTSDIEHQQSGYKTERTQEQHFTSISPFGI